VELDLVDAVPEAVVGAKARRVVVGRRGEADCLGAARRRADLDGPVGGPLAALAPQRLDQHPVGREDVEVLQRRRLVDHLVRLAGEPALGGRHAGILAGRASSSFVEALHPLSGR
jgi:hypothetical protein